MIHYGDTYNWLETLEPLSVDHVITDPPYSEKTHKAQRRGCTGYVEPTRPNATGAQFNRKRELGFTHITEEERHLAADHFKRIARRWVLIFSDHEGSHDWRIALQAAGLEYVRTMIWIKRGSTPQFTGDRPATIHECIVVAHQTKDNGKPMKKQWNGRGKHGLYTTEAPADTGEIELGVFDHPIVLNRGKQKTRLHTAQKPLALMEQLVRDFTNEGEIVCDPYTGAATTLVACRNLNRIPMGCEGDELWHAAATARLAGEPEAEIARWLVAAQADREAKRAAEEAAAAAVA